MSRAVCRRGWLALFGMPGWPRRSAAAAAVALLALLTIAAPASAASRPSDKAHASTTPQVVVTGLGPGQGVAGFIANAGSSFNPVKDGYPTSNPSTGFTPLDESFAGIIYGMPYGGGPTLSFYCIDLSATTGPGVGYVLGSWGSSNVPNPGYVARILATYYPNSNDPANLGIVDQKAAAVQAAIWFFTDGYVLNTSDGLHDTVAEIVAGIIAAGPLTEQPPSLSISPTSQTGPAGTVLGPYTLTSSAPATVTATGADMYSDAGATMPIANGTVVASGTKIWLKSTTASSAVLQASAEATVPDGSIYLYAGNTSLVQAQKLVLASTATLETTVNVTGTFQAPGSLVVEKTITGPAAGDQGQVVITTACNGAPLSPDLVIPSGTNAGTIKQTYTGIAAGSSCVVTESINGGSNSVTVTVTGSGQTVVVPAGGTITAALTDTYQLAPGSLIVKKTIGGAAAGKQGEVVIHTVCDGTALSPDFVIPANTKAGTVSQTYTGIAGGSSCTVTETSDGSTSTVRVTIQGNGQIVTVPAGGTGEATVTDTYTATTTSSGSPTTTTTTSPSGTTGGSLPFTGLGSGAGQLRDAGLAALAGGVVLSVVGRRRRHRIGRSR